VIYICLRPALAALERRQRLRLILLGSGYWIVFVTFGGCSVVRLHIHLMQIIGWLRSLVENCPCT